VSGGWGLSVRCAPFVHGSQPALLIRLINSRYKKHTLYGVEGRPTFEKHGKPVDLDFCHRHDCELYGDDPTNVEHPRSDGNDVLHLALPLPFHHDGVVLLRIILHGVGDNDYVAYGGEFSFECPWTMNLGF